MTIRLCAAAIAAGVLSFAAEGEPAKALPPAMRRALEQIDLMAVQAAPAGPVRIQVLAPVGKCAIRLREFKGAAASRMPEYKPETTSRTPMVVPMEPCPDEEEKMARTTPRRPSH